MKLTRLAIIACLAAVSGSHAVAGEKLGTEERVAATKLAKDHKTALLSKNYEAIVDLLDPELVRASGGREKQIQLLRDEEAKSRAEGFVIESIDLTPTDDVHVGSRHRVTFVTSVMVARMDDARIRSTSFQVAFLPLGTGKTWYMIDGTKLTRARFRQLFPGLPQDLELPKVTKVTTKAGEAPPEEEKAKRRAGEG